MMQEVIGDDTNGESTFEFVEGKLEDLQLSGSSTMEAGAGNSMTGGSYGGPPGPAVPVTATAYSITSMSSVPAPSTPGTSLAFSSVPPPAALPSFLSSPEHPAVSSLPPITTAQSYPPPVPLSSSGPIHTQPTYHTPPAPPSGTTSIFTPPPTSSSLAVELPLSGYEYSASSPPNMEEAPQKGMWGWIKGTVSGNEFLSKVAEKAKNSVDSMITTLDPQMKDYIYSGGDVDIVVASDKEDKVGPVREAFQVVFGRATIMGESAQANIAVQPVGYSAGLKGAEDRVNYLRQTGRIHERQPVLAIENFLAELSPERWFDIGCLMLDDPAIGDPLQVYTQATPVSLQYVNQMQNDTPGDYPLRWSGFSVTVGNVIGRSLQVPHTQWHHAVVGVPRREMIFTAAKALATLYKTKREIGGVSVAQGWQ